MTRLSNKQYQWRAMLVMAAYVGLILLVWPLAKTAQGSLPKVLFALTPVLPMLYLFALMARRIRDSDELEQRMHLIALGVATSITAAASLVGGFLAAAKVVDLDGSILIWVFPLMMVSYGIARSVVARRYGGDMLACAAGPDVPMSIRALFVTVLMALVAAFAYMKSDSQTWGAFAGMALSCLIFGVVMLLRRWRRKRAAMGMVDGGSVR